MAKRVGVIEWKSKNVNANIWLDLHEEFATSGSRPTDHLLTGLCDSHVVGLVYTTDKAGNLVRIWASDNINHILSTFVAWPHEVVIKWHESYWQDSSGVRYMKQAKQDIKRVAARNYLVGHGRNLKFPNTVNFT